MSEKKITEDNDQVIDIVLNDVVTDNDMIVHANAANDSETKLVNGVINILTGYDNAATKMGPHFTPLKLQFPYTYTEDGQTKVGSRTAEALITSEVQAAATSQDNDLKNAIGNIVESKISEAVSTSGTIQTTINTIAENVVETNITTDNTLIFKGASTTSAGRQGLVPPSTRKASEESATKYLGDDGKWHELGGTIEDPICYVPTQDTNSPSVYDGTTKTPTWDENFIIKKLSVDYGSNDRINAGTYTATFTPKTGYSWEDGTTVAKTANWVIEPQPIDITTGIPSQSGTLTYSGSAQSPEWDNYDSIKMTVADDSATDAGTYTATFTPTANYKWSDDSANKAVNWSINKAIPTISLSDNTKNVYVSEDSSITVTRDGDGVISATSSDTTVATVYVSDTTVVIDGLTDGTATISVTVAEGTNYLAITTPVTCTVTVISATIFGITYAVAGGHVRGVNWKNVDNSGTVITIADSDRYPHN